MNATNVIRGLVVLSQYQKNVKVSAQNDYVLTNVIYDTITNETDISDLVEWGWIAVDDWWGFESPF